MAVAIESHGILAAHRAGLKTIILPKRNQVDLEELPEEVLETLTFKFVESMDQVFPIAVGLKKKKRSKKSS